MFRRLAGALASVIFGYASYWSVRLAIADHFARDHSATAIERAIRLAPNNPEYYLRLADVSPPAAPAAIERAVELNPLNSSVWLERAQVAEDRKDYPAAETYLLRAVELDRTLAPRWSLTAYYFRRPAPQRFWPAVRAALDVSYDDVTPLFEMCWKLAPEPARILHDAIPARPAVLRQYLDFLLAQNRPDLAAPVVKQLLQNPAPDSLGSLLDYCDLLLSKGNLSPALETWNILASKRLLNDPPLAPAQGLSLTNSRFEFPFLSRGFDWRLEQSEGVFAVRRGSPALLRFDFSGKQPEICELLSRYLPLEPSRHYRLTVTYETTTLSGNTGLKWRVLDSVAGSDLLPEAWLHASEGSPLRQQFAFSVASGVRLGRLLLEYDRIPGTVLIEGSLSLRAVELAFAK